MKTNSKFIVLISVIGGLTACKPSPVFTGRNDNYYGSTTNQPKTGYTMDTSTYTAREVDTALINQYYNSRNTGVYVHQYGEVMDNFNPNFFDTNAQLRAKRRIERQAARNDIRLARAQSRSNYGSGYRSGYGNRFGLRPSIGFGWNGNNGFFPYLGLGGNSGGLNYGIMWTPQGGFNPYLGWGGGMFNQNQPYYQNQPNTQNQLGNQSNTQNNTPIVSQSQSKIGKTVQNGPVILDNAGKQVKVSSTFDTK